MPFYSGTSNIVQPNPILGIPDFRQSTNPQISVKAQPHADLLSTSFRFLAFLQFIWHGNRLSTGLQSTLTRAMASICVHRASRTPPDSTPGHIRLRDGLQEDHRPATHGRQSPVRPDQSPSPHFREIHLARQSPFYGPPGHIDSRDGVNLCPSSVANPSRQHSRAYPLAR